MPCKGLLLSEEAGRPCSIAKAGERVRKEAKVKICDVEAEPCAPRIEARSLRRGFTERARRFDCREAAIAARAFANLNRSLTICLGAKAQTLRDEIEHMAATPTSLASAAGLLPQCGGVGVVGAEKGLSVLLAEYE